MNSRQNSYPYYMYQPGNVQTQVDTQNINQRIANIERQLDMLIRMVEYNNQMLRYLQLNNVNMTSSGGGSIIVRM